MDDATGRSMPDRPESSPSAERAPAPEPESSESAEPKRRHRVIVWSLIVLASVLLILSITANWVQRALLNTDEVTDTTERDPRRRGRAAAAQHLHGRSALRHRRRPGPDRAASCRTPPRRLPLRSRRRSASSPPTWPRRALASPQVQDLVSSAVASGAPAVRRPDRGRGRVRLDHRRRGHARVRERRRRPRRPASEWIRRRSRRSRASCRSSPRTSARG